MPKEPSFNGTESFSLTGQTSLLIINSSLDYELVKRYTVVMRIVDIASNPPVTGTIVARVCIGLLENNSFDFSRITRDVEHPYVFLPSRASKIALMDRD